MITDDLLKKMLQQRYGDPPNINALSVDFGGLHPADIHVVRVIWTMQLKSSSKVQDGTFLHRIRYGGDLTRVCTLVEGAFRENGGHLNAQQVGYISRAVDQVRSKAEQARTAYRRRHKSPTNKDVARAASRFGIADADLRMLAQQAAQEMQKATQALQSPNTIRAFAEAAKGVERASKAITAAFNNAVPHHIRTNSPPDPDTDPQFMRIFQSLHPRDQAYVRDCIEKGGQMPTVPKTYEELKAEEEMNEAAEIAELLF